MKFVFPDSLDLVDPTFDFVTETRSATRIRQRDDLYPHEIFHSTLYDGMLVSKAIVDGLGGGGAGRYTIAQRQRLLRNGVRDFFRLAPRPIFTMGDCGAFTYVKEEQPPYSVEDVVGFYETCGFDYGMSVDHVIVDYKPEYDTGLLGADAVPTSWRDRQHLSLELANEFRNMQISQRCRFQPLGVAQGWSPDSYAFSVAELQRMGYRYIAIGGLVPLRTADILTVLQAASHVRCADTRFHLLGVTRCQEVNRFAQLGAASFDSTSPLRQAFKDDKDNYYALDRSYSAIRVPQVDGNPRLQRQIVAGVVDSRQARLLERECLEQLIGFDAGMADADKVIAAVTAYQSLQDPLGTSKDRTEAYRAVLRDRPWKDCPCEICKALGIHVVIFRGAERNRRRGFHNIFAFRRRLDHQLSYAE